MFGIQKRVLVGAALAIAVLGAPVAGAAGEGKSFLLGKRNPKKGAVIRTSTLIAKTNVGTFALKIDNKGTGGAADLSCRSAVTLDFANVKTSVPCLRGINRKGGEAFQFVTLTGLLGGVIQTGPDFATLNPNARPFVTNATGEATGLNADKVDGMNAADIITAAQAQAPAGSAPSFAFARVAAAGTTDQSRSQGVTDANIQKGGVGIYCFVSLSSRPKNASVTLDGVAGETSLDTTTKAGAPCPDTTKLDLLVRTYDSAGAPADRPFYVSITGTTGA